MAVSTGLSAATYFSPDNDTQSAFLDFVHGTKSHLRIAIYGLHLPPLDNELVSLHQQGIDVALVCDSTQAAGKYEYPEILQLIESGIPLLVGTSEKQEIMHHKFAVRDKTQVLSGSWNFSLSASKESNYFYIIQSPDRAALFLSKWQEMWSWISAHECQNASIIDGDLTATGLQSDYDSMNKVLKSYRHPFNTLFTIGNHEFYSAIRDKYGRRNTKAFPNGATKNQCIHRFLQNSGMPRVYHDKWIHGYHFIMLGSEESIITNHRRLDCAFLSDTQLAWLRKKLMESPRHRPIFVFLHQPIPYTVDGSTWGDIVNPNKLRSILSRYPQVVFSGHSLRTLKGQSHARYRNGFTMFNDSLVRNSVNARNRPVGDSEGLYLEVYDEQSGCDREGFHTQSLDKQVYGDYPHFNPK